MPLKQSSQKLKPSIEFEALGTYWFIEAESGISKDEEHLIHEALGAVDRTWSRFRDDSLVAHMSRMSGEYLLERVDRTLMKWYETLYRATHGHVTPLIGQALEDAGYDSSYRLTPKITISRTPEWDEVIQLTDTGIKMKQPALLDVGAAGKGLAIDVVAAIFKDRPYTIDAGGDIRLQGRPQTIGLEHPLRPGELIGTCVVVDKSICGSATNRRQWGDWHHIINPKTSKPIDRIVATWAIADTAMRADGIASALFFTPAEELKALGDFLYVIMYDDDKVYHTNTNDIQLFT